jgi:hypothetical protein
MLGDNLYDDNYRGEFSVPYQGLLERGVLFYAALGNHDRELEQHFKPFHMTDRLFFAFTEGNARFVALNSNHPADRAQLAWFDTHSAAPAPSGASASSITRCIPRESTPGRAATPSGRRSSRRWCATAIVRDGREAFVGSQSLRKLELDKRREAGLLIKSPSW